MKHKIKLLSISFLLISFITISQNKVEASKIMQDIKAGKSIFITDATISGVLDFTYMDEMLQKLSDKKKNSWWNLGKSDNTIKKTIAVKISFINCTFRDDVLAYIPDEDSGYTFIANFEDIAIFKNCNFNRKAMFKYSHFAKNSDFSGTTFDEDSTFKYAKFHQNISFANTVFDEIATFKYAKFNKNVSFSNAVFKDSAIFKYTEFYNDDIDSKYTRINGMSFSKYLINKK